MGEKNLGYHCLLVPECHIWQEHKVVQLQRAVEQRLTGLGTVQLMICGGRWSQLSVRNYHGGGMRKLTRLPGKEDSRWQAVRSEQE